MGVVIYLADTKPGRRKDDPLELAFRKLHRDIAAIRAPLERIEDELKEPPKDAP